MKREGVRPGGANIFILRYAGRQSPVEAAVERIASSIVVEQPKYWIFKMV